MEHELVVRNTLLLRTYQEVDQRAWLLIMLVKVWAKQAGVADASHGTLSSYAWALLSIFYLQQCEPPVLPTLQSEELAGEGTAWHRPASAATENWATSFCEDQAAAKATLAANRNTQTIAELLCGFFHFYGWSFPCVMRDTPCQHSLRITACSLPYGLCKWCTYVDQLRRRCPQIQDDGDLAKGGQCVR